jgi:hypothetical protein
MNNIKMKSYYSTFMGGHKKIRPSVNRSYQQNQRHVMEIVLRNQAHKGEKRLASYFRGDAYKLKTSPPAFKEEHY